MVQTQKIKITLLISVTLCAAVMLPLSARGSNQKKTDYNHFTHKTHSGLVKIPGSQETQELKCNSCHERQVSRAPTDKPVATTERNTAIAPRSRPISRSLIVLREPFPGGLRL